LEAPQALHIDPPQPIRLIDDQQFPAGPFQLFEDIGLPGEFKTQHSDYPRGPEFTASCRIEHLSKTITIHKKARSIRTAEPIIDLLLKRSARNEKKHSRCRPFLK
jgi:hypothetical protein